MSFLKRSDRDAPRGGGRVATPLAAPGHEPVWAQATRNATLPATDENALVPPDGVHLHLRDWRQFEFVSVKHLGAVEKDLAAIHAIWARDRVSAQGTSVFRKMHVRVSIPEPMSLAVERADLEDLLAAKLRPAAFDGHAHPLRDVFAAQRGALVFYGAIRDARLVTFGVELLAEPDLAPDVAHRVQRFVEMNDLMLVHWPSRTLFPSAKAAASYFVSGAL